MMEQHILSLRDSAIETVRKQLHDNVDKVFEQITKEEVIDKLDAFLTVQHDEFLRSVAAAHPFHGFTDEELNCLQLALRDKYVNLNDLFDSLKVNDSVTQVNISELEGSCRSYEKLAVKAENERFERLSRRLKVNKDGRVS